ncbi:MAG: response regulator transcription factor, partial [Oscillospiraceae bacterium]|nr:response regulator transcription factor [Oscillospiraceae bacterium]
MNDRIRVVVADDQNISRGFFEMYVRASTRYELEASLRTAQEAVEYVDKQETDLLILDVMMQEGIDGLSAAGQIKQKHPEVKIILTTSTSETSWEEKARAMGVESFWYKEYDEHSLVDIMDRTADGESVYPAQAPQVSFGKGKRSDLTER